ncbi:hypothetical protein OJAV_G00002230 [Oryzias javanicus]|uniref:Uncharacterized protein n=1 Tax=Oryzias javanicus TaxID=123683 RepID=A0A3S2PHA2_ORYJA|nr:hypothetical protein OJAV_G00002230 [Oryzias javanicus]
MTAAARLKRSCGFCCKIQLKYLPSRDTASGCSTGLSRQANRQAGVHVHTAHVCWSLLLTAGRLRREEPP